jgi:hypothetical protein
MLMVKSHTISVFDGKKSQFLCCADTQKHPGLAANLPNVEYSHLNTPAGLAMSRGLPPKWLSYAIFKGKVMIYQWME